MILEGEKSISTAEDFNSHNANRLTVDQIKSLLLEISYVRDAINA